MRGKGFFPVPDELADGLALVTRVIELEGRGQPTAGAITLGDWLLANRDAAQRAFAGAPFSERQLFGILSGAVMPGDDDAEWLGKVTGGAVDKLAFQRVLPGHVQLAALIGEQGPELSEATHAPSHLLCSIAGPLGTTPSGPLFAAILDPMVPSQFVIAGLGQAQVFDRSRAQAMLDALADGLARIPA